MFKSVIYVICDKYEFLISLIFDCYPIPQLNCKLESLAVSFQRMTLSVSFKREIVEKNLFALISTFFKILEFSALFVKEMVVLLRVQFQTQICFESALVVCVQTLVPSKIFFFYI